MSSNEEPKDPYKPVWPGGRAALRRLALIAAVLFPCTWVVNALLVKSWNLLGDRDAESYRHLREAAVIFVLTTCAVFLLSFLPRVQRIFRWMCSWRVVRRVLIVLAWVVTIVALFYGEENWRGRRAWNKYSETLKAQGAELDLKAFIPPPIPDDKNFAAIPEVQAWFTQRDQSQARWNGDNFALASAQIQTDPDKPPRRFMDLVAWKMAFDAVKAGQTNSTDKIKSDKLDRESLAAAAPVVLDALKPLEPIFAEFRAVAQRPEARYPVAYDLDNPWGILLPHYGNIRQLCLRLQLKACAELAAGQGDRALKDVKLILRLCDSLHDEPFLIGYLVRAHLVRIAIQPVWEGLAERRWSDAQLQELQSLLQRYDFISDLKPPLDGERAAGILTADLLAAGKYTLNNLTSDPGPLGSTSANAFGRIMPHGWYELEKFNYTRLYDLQMEGAFDVQEKRVSAGRIESNTKALDKAFAGRNPFTTILTRHQLLAVIMLPAIGKIPAKGAAAQTAVNQVLIACALERYRLAHGQFPDELNALMPEFISKLPHDVITGEPYKYRRTTDGQFVLYSVGWNEKDDGGTPGKKLFDDKEGDWVW